MKETVSTTIMLPVELRQWLEDRAAKETRNLSKQVIHLLSQKRAEIEAQEANPAEVA